MGWAPVFTCILLRGGAGGGHWGVGTTHAEAGKGVLPLVVVMVGEIPPSVPAALLQCWCSCGCDPESPWRGFVVHDERRFPAKRTDNAVPGGRKDDEPHMMVMSERQMALNQP